MDADRPGDAAEAQFKRALEKNYKDPDAVRLYLGQVSEERKRYDDALKWYGAVNVGEQYINAQARYAGVLSKQGKLADARKHLQQINPRSTAQRVQLTQAEAQLLREATAYQEAFDVLSRALEKLPDYPELLYDHAMAAEKVNRLDVLDIAADGSSATRTMVNLPMPAGRFRSVVQGTDGNLYVATDEGSIIQLKPN